MFKKRFNLTNQPQPQSSRIEPSFGVNNSASSVESNSTLENNAGVNTAASSAESSSGQAITHQNSHSDAPGIEVLLAKLAHELGKPKVQLGMIGFCIVLIGIMWVSLFNHAPDETNDTNQIQAPEIVIKSRLIMSEEYSLLLNEHDALIVNWQSDDTGGGDTVDAQNSVVDLWSISTGLGVHNCQSIEFNNGKSARVVKAHSENGYDYFAQFSPLDTELLLNGIADYSRFEICGNTFSLKGSKANLLTDPSFGQFLVY